MEKMKYQAITYGSDIEPLTIEALREASYKSELESTAITPASWWKMAFLRGTFVLLALTLAARSTFVDSAVLDACPGYKATNVKTSGTGLTAELSLAGTACNVFGNDIQKLKLSVVYETCM